MKIMGFEIQTDHLGRISLSDLRNIAVEHGYDQPLSVEEFASSDECRVLLNSREWMLHGGFADTIVALKYCERIDLEFMFDVYYALGL